MNHPNILEIDVLKGHAKSFKVRFDWKKQKAQLAAYMTSSDYDDLPGMYELRELVKQAMTLRIHKEIWRVIKEMTGTANLSESLHALNHLKVLSIKEAIREWQFDLTTELEQQKAKRAEVERYIQSLSAEERSALFARFQPSMEQTDEPKD